MSEDHKLEILSTIVQLHDLEVKTATEVATAWHDLYEKLALAAAGIDLEKSLRLACDAEYELTGDTVLCGRLETLIVSIPSDNFNWNGKNGSATFEQVGLLATDDPETIRVSFVELDSDDIERTTVYAFSKDRDLGVTVEYSSTETDYRISLSSKYRVIGSGSPRDAATATGMYDHD